MKIVAYLKTSLIEWPGKICSVVFTPGCNFRCPFCHNRELVEVQRYKGAKVQRYKEEDVLKDLESRKKWVDAVVITGGEPTIQEGLDKFLKSIKKLKFLTMIHTNGTRPDILKKIINYQFSIINYIAMDVKGPLDDYERFIKVQSSKLKVKSSIEIIAASGVEYEFRTTVVPGLHNLENLTKLAKQIQELYAGQKENLRSKEAKKQRSIDEKQRSKEAKIKNFETLKLCVSESSPKWFLQQFRPMNTLDKKFLKVKPFSKEEMEGFQKELQKIVPNTFLRGI